MLKYPLIESLPSCLPEEINRVFDYMDDWRNELSTEFTLDLFYAIFPQFSGGESTVIFKSWQAAQQPHAGDGATGAQADVQSLSGDSAGDAGFNNPPRP